MILKRFGYSRKPSYERNVGKGSLNFLKADLGWSRFDIIYHCPLLHVQVLSLLNCPPFRNYLSKGEIALLYLVPYWSTPAKYRTGCVLFMINGGARELGLLEKFHSRKNRLSPNSVENMYSTCYTNHNIWLK